MGLFRKLFYRKPPDGLLEISQRLYVFDCCFMMDVLEGEEYKNYIGGIAGHLRDYLPNANFMVVNFREGEVQSQVAHILSEYDMTVMEYPRQYEGCPLLTMEMVHHFLRSSENWFSLGEQNVLLMHCERGGWPVLAFMLAGLLIYRKQYTGEQKTLDMIYKQAPSEVLQLMSPLNALPSQLRYLQYISRRNLGSQWPPLSRALALDCIIIRFMPDIDGDDGRRLIVRIYGPDPLNLADQSPKVLLSMPKKSKIVRHCKQADSELVKIDINCNIQGDIVFECISLDDDLEREHMMFRFMFNTSFIGSNILMLNRDEIDILWNAKDHFPKDFRTEVIFSEMDIATSLVAVDLPGFEEKEGLPVEAFSRVEELFSNADWLDQKTDAAANALQQITASNILQELETDLPQGSKKGSELFGSSLEKIKHEPKASCNIKNPASTDQGKRSISLSNLSLDAYVVGPKFVPKELQISLQRPAQCKIISPRVHGNFLSSQTSSQGSPMPMSRYQNASSPLGITALLEDHVSLNTKEAIHSGTLDASSVSSMASILNLSRPVHINAAMHPSTITPLPFSSQSSVDACTTAVTTALSSNIISSVWRPLEPIAPLVHPPLLSPLSTQYLNETQIQAALSPALSVCHPSLNTTHPSGIQNDKGRVSLFPSTPLPSLSHHKPSTSTTVSVPSIVPQPPLPIIKGATPSYSIGKSSSEPSSPPVYSSLQGPSPSLRDRKSTPSSPPPPPPSLLPPSTFASSITQTSLKSTIAPLTPVTASTATCPVSSVMPIEITPMSSVPSSPPLLLLPLISSGHGSILPTTSAPLTPGVTSSAICPVSPPMLMESTLISSAPSALHPPPPLSTSTSTSSSPGVGPPTISAPPPPPSPGVAPKSSSKSAAPVPPVPPPLASSAKGFPRVNSASRSDSGCKNGTVPPVLGPPSGAISSAKGQGLARPNFRSQVQSRRNNLKPYHWLKLTRAVHGSLWAETQKSDEASIAPEFDMQELESLFSAAVPSSEHGGKSRRRVAGLKPDKIQLVELRRANNCEIMLTKVKIPIPDLMSSVLALDDSMLDVDQVENLIKFCPTKEEIELLKGYKGDKEKLGKCEQFFLELMQVPRVESKLRVFAFKIQYSSQVSDLRANLNVVNSASEEIRNSAKLKRIMQTILSLGNALNHGTARGSAVGFRLDSLLKLTDTRARNKKMTLMHYLCKVLAEKLPELLDFPRDLVSLEVANKIQLKYLAEEMQAISKGLEKVVQELTASENDGPVSENFCKTLKEFLGYAEAEVGSLASLYSIVGRSADALALYFGEDPARCPFEQVVSTLSNFLRMFVRAHEENCKQLEFTKKKAQKNAENEKVKMSGLMDAEHLIRSPTQCSND